MSSTIQQVARALSLLPIADLPARWTRTGLIFTRTTQGGTHFSPLVSADDDTALTNESPPQDPGDGSAQLAIDAYTRLENSTPLFTINPGFPPHFVDVVFTRTPEGDRTINYETALTLVVHQYFAAQATVQPSTWSDITAVTVFENERRRIDLRLDAPATWTAFGPAAIAVVAMSPSGRSLPPAGNYTIAAVTAFPPTN